MAATLDEIDSAIYAALQPCSKANGGPAFVDRYAGQLTASAGVDEELLSRAPALLLSFDGERARTDWQGLAGDMEIEGGSTWSVLCTTVDPRNASKRVKGSVGITGAYALVGTVIAALNGLAIPGLIRGERLLYQGAVPVLIRPGLVYVVAARFLANRAVEQVSEDVTIPEYEGTTGDIHLTEQDGAPDPFVVFESDPEA